MRAIVASVLVLALTACAPAAGTGSSASPTVSAPSSPPATSVASATPTATAPAGGSAPATATPIVLPTSTVLAAAGNGVLWALVADSRLFVSADRGDTWTERRLPAGLSFESIAFVSDREGWILSAGSPGTQCQAQSVTVYRTTDGATTWQQIAPQGIAAAQCKTALAFNDATHGYLTSWDPNAAPRVYRTTDAGLTWSASQPLADPPGFTTTAGVGSLRAAGVADFLSVSFVGAFGFVDGREVDYVYRSSDRGATWTYMTKGPAAGTVPIFVTPTRWLQITLPSSSQETTNGGVSWHAFATDYSQAAPVAPQVVFGDAMTGYATVRGSIRRTTDGGAHWTALRTPGT